MFKLQNVDKCVKTLDMLGCSIEELKLHIVSNFYSNMDWDKKNLFLIIEYLVLGLIYQMKSIQVTVLVIKIFIQ